MIIKINENKEIESGDIICFAGGEVFLIIDNDTNYSAIDLEYHVIYFTSKTISLLVDALVTNCGVITNHIKNRDIVITKRNI